MASIKRFSKKTLCLILSLVLIIGTITVVFTTKSFREIIEAKAFLSDYTKRIVDTKNITGLEKSEMSDSRVIALKQSDGSVTSYGFSEPITFKDAKGNLKSKDISIVRQKDKSLKKKGFDYTNGDNDYRVNISSDIRNGVNASFKGSSFTMIPNVEVKEKKVSSVAGNQTLHISPFASAMSPVTLSVSGAVVESKEDNYVSYKYEDVYGEGTYLSVEPQLNGVNEKIVLCDVEDVEKVSFTLFSDDSTPVLQEDGGIALVNNKTKQATQSIAAPILSTEDLDSQFVIGEYFGRGEYTLQENGDDSYTLGIDIPDRANIDLSDYGDLVITIPGASIMATGSGHISPFLDTGIYNGTPSTCYNNEVLACFGRDSGYGYGRALTHFTMPTAIKRGATINSAYFWTRETTGATTTTYVQPFLVYDVWTSQTTWNTRPTFAGSSTMSRRNINSNSSDVSGNPYWYKFNIAQAVNLWVKGTKPDRGVIFKSEEETNHNYRWRAFATKEYTTSSMRPYTIINYTNDTTAPTLTSVSGNPTAWTKNNVTLTVNGASDSGSGLNASPYSFSTTQGTYAWQASNQKTFSSNQTVYIYLRDYLGNKALRKTVTINRIDKLKPNSPTVSLSQTGWSQNDISITVQANDATATTNNGKSGVKYYSCTQTAGQYNWVALDDTNLNGSYTFTNISNGTYYIYSKDIAGNICETATTVTAQVDPEAPVVNDVTINTNAATNLSSVKIEASDVTSGINAYSLNGGQDWTEVNPSTNNLDITAQSTLDSDSIDVRVKDLSGRVSDGNILALTKPEFYDYNGMVGIFNPNLNGATVEYRFNDEDDWITYEKPIEIEESQTVYAKFSNSASAVYNQFTPLAASTDYVDSQTDLTVTNNNLSFEISREYNSGDNEWRFSTESSAELTHNGKIIETTMPDGVKTYYVKTAENIYADEITGYTLNETADSYIINAGGEIYTYNKSNGRLADISDSFEHHIEFAYNLLGELESITATSGSEERQYLVSEINGKIEYIKTPVLDSGNTREKLVYQYTADGLIKVYYDKDTLQFERNDDIIRNEYGYTNNKLTSTDGNTVNYNNEGQYLSLTTPAGETVSEETEPESNEPEEDPQIVTTYFDGTDIIHTETVTEVDGNTTTTTLSTYNISSQLLSVLQTKEVTNGAGGTEQVYSRSDVYTYFENTNTVHTETITETADSETSTTVITYNNMSNVVSEATTVSSKTIETAYTYDIWGNMLTSNTTVVEGGVPAPVSSTVCVYDVLNRCIKETVTEANTDPVVTRKAYNPLGVVIYEQSGSNITRTLYDKYGRAIQEIEPADYSSAADGIVLSGDVLSGEDSYSDSSVGHRYVYDETTRLLTSETNRLGVVTTYTYHNNSSVVATESFDVYVLSYNQDGKIISSVVNNNTYATYTYNDDGNPTSVIYGNGQSIHYVYDQNTGNLLNQYHNNDENNPYVVYEYVPAPDETLIDTGENLELEENLEVETNEDYVIKYKTNYDSNLYYTYYNSGNVTVAKADAQNTVIYSYNSVEGENGLETTVSGVIGNKNYSCVSASGSIVNTFDGASLSSEISADNSDVSTLKVNDSTVFTVTQTENNTSNVKSYGNTLTFTDTFASNDKLRISSSSDGTDTTSYTYYTDGQLHTAIGTNYSASYTYDSRGNLSEKTVNNVTTDYTYSCDRLTAVGNTVLTYDSIGNVLTFGNKQYTWSSGRNLASITDGTNTYSYTYNKYGYRTGKTVGGTTTDFCVEEDGKIVAQTDGTNTFFFEYSEDNTPLGFVLNGTQYIYVTNNSADVMAIANSLGNIIATYSYDEWGKVTVNATGEQNIAVANLNPIRYRGYYYDNETGYYYLQSRYYDPEICRFINADLPEYAKEQKNETAGINVFVYCCNDAVNNSDPSGNRSNYSFCGISISKFEKETKMIYNNIKKVVGNIKTKKFKSVDASNPKSFRDAWNNLPDSTIDFVIINVHGNSNSINGFNLDRIHNLRSKKIRCLWILSCDSSHITMTKNNNGVRLSFYNVASEFARITGGGVVVGSNGLVRFFPVFKDNVPLQHNLYSEGHIKTISHRWYMYKRGGKKSGTYNTGIVFMTAKKMIRYIRKEKMVNI